MATLKLQRESVILELRRGPFQVLIDAADVGSIDSHQTIDVPIEPGRHRLQVKDGRYSSRSLDFEASDGEVVTFRCSGARIWPIYLASLLAPGLALSLKRE